ncbi:MAG: 16S rRNA (guanine(527)-N(7))-methyltransferase RsmG [Bacteroidota bacterium]
MELIKKYFPHLESEKLALFEKLYPLYQEWNNKINVISRKDMENFYTNHVLHSLAISKVISFAPGSRIMDVGTGGGFPGIPLAILFPQCTFYLVDSIEKKIKVVREITKAAGLTNVTSIRDRAENIDEKFDFVVSRAVTALPAFVRWVKNNISSHQQNELPNGILYLKGGDFLEELQQTGYKFKTYPIELFFREPFFETKMVVHLYR